MWPLLSVLLITLPVISGENDATLIQKDDVTVSLGDSISITGIEDANDPWAFYANPEIGDHAEGDLYISPSVQNRRTMLNSAKRWPDGNIPFYLHDVIKKNKRAYKILLNAMRLITKYTDKCIQFYPITLEHIKQYPDLVYVNITGDQEGCFSELGQRYKATATRLNLNVRNCFHLPGHAIHELCHVLGQIHEHMRPDRDEYVTINWDNIDPKKHDNFQIMKPQEVSTFDLPYDYESITHYHRTAFAMDPTKPTIIPLNQSATIGQRTHLSPLDVKKLLRGYNCDQTKKPFNITEYLFKSQINSETPPSNLTLETKKEALARDQYYIENLFQKLIDNNRLNSYSPAKQQQMFTSQARLHNPTQLSYLSPQDQEDYSSSQSLFSSPGTLQPSYSSQNLRWNQGGNNAQSSRGLRLTFRSENVEKSFCFNPKVLELNLHELILRECPAPSSMSSNLQSPASPYTNPMYNTNLEKYSNMYTYARKQPTWSLPPKTSRFNFF